jgi:hypothetical protein
MAGAGHMAWTEFPSPLFPTNNYPLTRGLLCLESLP